MRRRATLLFGLGVLVLGLLAGCASGTAPTTISPTPVPTPATDIITVTGNGQVNVSPDIAVATLGVETRNVDVTQAVSDNNSASKAIEDAIRALGVQDKDIQTSNFTVYSQDITGSNGESTGQVEYVVDNSVLVTIRDLSKLGQILGAALGAGANSVQGITFSLADQTQAMAQARVKAVADAQARAATLALAAGVKLGPPISISEVTVSPTPVMAQAMGLGGGGSSPVPVSSGTLSVEVSVTMVFQIQ
ncbi:MAG: SIMPL domain-containing protein [Anaerolineales bacterium]